MFDRTPLTENEIAALLLRTEGQYLDFKSSRNSKPVLKSVSSFANADGGDLYVGVGDAKEADRFAHLFSEEEDANNIVSEIFDMFKDGPEFIEGKFLDANGRGLILWLTIQKTPFVVRTPSGDVFKRLNASDKKITGSELTRLELDKGIASAENRATGIGVEELDNSEVSRLFCESLVPEMDVKSFVVRERLVDSSNKLRFAGALVFHDYPQPEIPYAAVKLYRYKSFSDEGERENLEGQPETVEGPIYYQIIDSVNRTKEIIENIPILSKSGLQEIRYPPEAIHEVICNAILHRDYSINDYVHIRIFENRVEVESPGKLAGHVTTKNILRQRFARNNKIVRLLAKFPDPPNKDVGEGLNTTFRAMQQLNLKRPEIVETSASVLVRLAHEPLASREEIIKKYIEKNGDINNTKAREICSVQSDSVIRKIFSEMIKSGEIEKVPNTRARGTKYRIKV